VEAIVRKHLKFVVAAFVALAAVGVATIAARAGESAPREAAVSSRQVAASHWSKESVALFARLPVQDGGRVKPLSTYAAFCLLSLNGKRSVTTPAKVSLDPTAWLMDCLFFPEEAVRYECFVVDMDAAIDAIGLAHDGKSRRDRYSYVDLEPARERLFSLAQQFSAIEEKSRDAVQAQVLHLAQNVRQFESIAALVGTASRIPEPSKSPALAKVFGVDASPGLADVLERADDVRPFLAVDGSPHGAAGGDAALAAWVDEVANNARDVALLPPTSGDHAEWLSPGAVVAATLFHGERLPEQVAALRDLESMSAARGDDVAFRGHAESFRARVVGLAESRGEYGKVPLEVAYYRADLFFWAQVVFVVAFIFIALSWAMPGKWLPRFGLANVLLATAFLAAGITMRCVIRGRPPVSTLYESVLFVTAVGVIAALVAEYVNRRGIALALSSVLGAAGVFVANRYEVSEHVDTMPSLVAVLDTNFWLASHVTTVTIGYGAGLLAGLVGHVYVLGKVFGLKKDDAGFYKTLSSMTYGTLCFGLLFSVVGTVLGGIWANESWGRFWGWDPKENGALTIVLWELIVLHGRMGGYLRDFGVAMASVFGAVVVASSWWGVNLLGVGLHSYGFTSGILLALLGFYAVEAIVLGLGGVHLALRRAAPAPASSMAPPAAPIPEVVQGGV
jgi:ABC-type transport system involved in cytochrome c biogenesis permease subunit